MMGKLDFETVGKMMFLAGVSPTGVDILNMHRCSGELMRDRSELFQKQIETISLGCFPILEIISIFLLILHIIFQKQIEIISL